MRRRWFVCGAVVVALSGWWVLGIGWEDVWPGGNGWRLAGEFGGAALRPALVYQDGRVGEAPFWGN